MHANDGILGSTYDIPFLKPLSLGSISIEAQRHGEEKGDNGDVSFSPRLCASVAKLLILFLSDRSFDIFQQGSAAAFDMFVDSARDGLGVAFLEGADDRVMLAPLLR
jgi:hypothetical protein